MPVVLDPDAAAVYKAFLDAGRPPYETLTPPQARADYLAARPATNPEPPELQSVAPLSIPAPHGAIPARVYRPMKLRDRDGLAPCLVFFHGGCFVIGDLDSHDVVCRKLAHEGELVVISVDYRLAPEHKFPAAFDDAITATAWISDNASTLGIDAARLCVGGDSAGGNLAAVVSLLARDAGTPAIAFQLLIYPASDQRCATPSHERNAQGYLLTRDAIKYFRGHYLPAERDWLDWRASPLLAQSHAGLPPALVITAGYDPLRDEGSAYADKLRAAGVKVAYREYADMVHGFLLFGGVLDSANAAVAECAAALRGAFERVPA